ncbi:MAG: Uma2 family endonuclease [Verrucomicrobiota bacterium]
MSGADEHDLYTVEEYLALEAQSDSKNEYLAGVIYAMAGASNRHNRISMNSYIALGNELAGKPCQPFNSDTKVRIQTPTQTRFYYPDAMIVCRPNDENDTFQDSPVVIIEVLSSNTRRTDEGEKKESYLTIPSLSHYLLVEPDEPLVTVHARVDQGFERTVVSGLDAVIPFPAAEAELALDQLYRGIEFQS